MLELADMAVIDADIPIPRRVAYRALQASGALVGASAVVANALAQSSPACFQIWIHRAIGANTKGCAEGVVLLVGGDIHAIAASIERQRRDEVMRRGAGV